MELFFSPVFLWVITLVIAVGIGVFLEWRGRGLGQKIGKKVDVERQIHAAKYESAKDQMRRYWFTAATVETALYMTVVVIWFIKHS